MLTQEFKARFQPKGSMCAVCVRRLERCNPAWFNLQPVIERYVDTSDIPYVNVAITKCSHFERKP